MTSTKSRRVGGQASSRWVLSFSCCLVLSVCLGITPSANAVTLTSEIENDLGMLESAVQDLQVSWVRERTSKLGIGAALKEIGAESSRRDLFARQKVSLKVSGERLSSTIDRFTVSTAEGKFKAFVPLHDDFSFDGDCLYQASPGAGAGSNPIVIITPIAKLLKTAPASSVFVNDYLEFAGIWVPSTPSEFGGLPQSVVLRAQAAEGNALISVTAVEEAAKRLWRVEIGSDAGTDIFFLDPSMLCAVQRREFRLADGALVWKSDCKDFVRLPTTDVYLPRSITVQANRWPTAAESSALRPGLLNQTFRMSHCSHNRMDVSEFEIQYDKPGTYVADGRLAGASESPSGRLEFEVPADPEMLDSAIRSAQSRVSHRPAFWIFAMSCLTLLGSVVLAAWMWRRKRNA